MLTARCFYTTILIVVYKKACKFLQAQNGEITHLYFCFLCFYTYICYMSFWQIFNDCDFSFFGDYNIFLIHLFYFTHHCTSVNRKVICKVGKRERKIKGVFPFSVLMYSKKSKACSSASADRECLCEQDFFMRFFDICTYNPLVFTAMLFTTGCKFWVFHEINFAVCFGTQIKNSVVWFGYNAGDDYVALFIKRNNSPLIFGIVGCQINSSFFYDANCVIFGWICSYDFTPFILSFNRFKTLVYPDEIWFLSLAPPISSIICNTP